MGTLLLLPEPSPSCPNWLLPQQKPCPAAVTAQVWLLPAEMETNVCVVPALKGPGAPAADRCRRRCDDDGGDGRRRWRCDGEGRRRRGHLETIHRRTYRQRRALPCRAEHRRVAPVAVIRHDPDRAGARSARRGE